MIPALIYVSTHQHHPEPPTHPGWDATPEELFDHIDAVAAWVDQLCTPGYLPRRRQHTTRLVQLIDDTLDT